MANERRARLLLLFGSLGLGLLVAAIAGEIVSRRIRPLDLGSSIEHRVPHATRGWELERGARYVNQVGAVRVPVHYTDEGWRDVEHALPRPPGERRVVVLGDSFMEGYSVPLEDVFSRRLESRLSAPDGPLSVVNLGVGGYGTLQQLITFREAGRRHGPQLVLLGFFENDLQNNLRELEVQANAGDPLKVDSRPYLADGPEWSIHPPDFSGAVARMEAAQQHRRTSLWERFETRSALARQIARAGRRLASIGDLFGAAWRRATRLLGGSAEADRRADEAAAAARCDALHRRAWETTERILERLRDEVAAAGARLVVFSVPSILGIHSPSVSDSTSRTIGPCGGARSGRSRLAAVTRRLEIPFIDLFPAFHRESGGDESVLFHRADGHWNARGHALAAASVAEALRERGLADFASAR